MITGNTLLSGSEQQATPSLTSEAFLLSLESRPRPGNARSAPASPLLAPFMSPEEAAVGSDNESALQLSAQSSSAQDTSKTDSNAEPAESIDRSLGKQKEHATPSLGHENIDGGNDLAKKAECKTSTKDKRKDVSVHEARIKLDQEIEEANATMKAAAAAPLSDWKPERVLRIYLDAHGRKFVFPFELCRTWKGMHGLICQAFKRNKLSDARELVEEGKYDLTVHQDIILPQVWECVVEPGWRVSMQMWKPKPHKSSSHKSQKDAGMSAISPEMGDECSQGSGYKGLAYGYDETMESDEDSEADSEYDYPGNRYGAPSNSAIEQRLRVAEEKGVRRGMAMARRLDQNPFTRSIPITPEFAIIGARRDAEREVNFYPPMDIQKPSPFIAPPKAAKLAENKAVTTSIDMTTSHGIEAPKLAGNKAVTTGIDMTTSDGIRKRIDRGGRDGRGAPRRQPREDRDIERGRSHSRSRSASTRRARSPGAGNDRPNSNHNSPSRPPSHSPSPGPGAVTTPRPKRSNPWLGIATLLCVIFGVLSFAMLGIAFKDALVLEIRRTSADSSEHRPCALSSLGDPYFFFSLQNTGWLIVGTISALIPAIKHAHKYHKWVRMCYIWIPALMSLGLSIASPLSYVRSEAVSNGLAGLAAFCHGMVIYYATYEEHVEEKAEDVGSTEMRDRGRRRRND